ncbi:MAG: carboxypeptidase-like regulatory domain-containing protein [Pyrinomonadaceae bacterium]
MSKNRRSRIRIALPLLGFCLLAAVAWMTLPQGAVAGPKGDTGILEKMVAASGNATVDLDLNRLNGKRSKSRDNILRFDVSSDGFFTSLAFNDEFRGTLPGTLGLVAKNSIALPAKLGASHENLVVETLPWGGHYEMVIRDGKSGFVFFNVEGQLYDYISTERKLNISAGRLLLSDEFAAELGRPGDTKSVVGTINIEATMTPIEVTHIVDGETQSTTLPPTNDPEAGTVPGPDVVVGDLSGLAQFGASSGTIVGLAIGTDSCNFGTVPLNWFANPSNDHPVIPQNLYRMSASGDRFEQVGHSQVKHAFTALQNNLCGLGCNATGGTTLGSGCSDPYGASLNAGPSLGSKAWINPFTGFYPRNDSATPNNSHTGHGDSTALPGHRIRVEVADLNTTLNSGATYYSEAQYVTPHEYAHCQANPTQCNMYNNVSYRRYSVNGTTCTSGTSSCYTFSPVGSTERMKPAIQAWTGSSIVEVRPAPGVDGVAFVAYKVTNPSAGVWHYEYAVYNQNLDRGIQSFSIPIGNGVTLSNVGFRMPPQHPGSANDGTFNSLGFSSAAWTQTQTATEMTWSSETLAQNPNANAIRWSTMYNFRFDSNRPPTAANATVGFFKTGSPVSVAVQGPSPVVASNVTVGGRVAFSNGSGVRTIVAISRADGFLQTMSTNSFGFYSFADIPSGFAYTLEVSGKRYIADPQTLTINNNISNVNFTVTER